MAKYFRFRETTLKNLNVANESFSFLFDSFAVYQCIYQSVMTKNKTTIRLFLLAFLKFSRSTVMRDVLHYSYLMKQMET